MESFRSKGGFSSTDFFLLLVSLIWGLNYVVAKVSLREMDPLLFTALRFVVGAVICWIILLMREKDFRITKRQFWHLFFTGIIAHGINQITFIYGVARTTAGAASIILASPPIWVALLAAFLKLEKVNGKTAIGIFISFLGVSLVVMGSKGTVLGGTDALWGNVLVFIAGIFWSIYTIMVRVYLKDLSIIKFTTYSITFTSIFFMAITYKQMINGDWSAYSAEAWYGVLFSGIFVLGISYILWNTAIQKVGPTRTAVYANLPPFISILVGWFQLGEMITGIQLIGGLIVLGGLIYVRKAKEALATAGIAE